VTAEPVRFALLRVEAGRREARSVPVQTFPTLEDAVVGAAQQPRQPNGTWQPGRVDGVWSQLDRSGQGFVVHRIDDPGPGVIRLPR
jgi:hypothetical protein